MIIDLLDDKKGKRRNIMTDSEWVTVTMSVTPTHCLGTYLKTG